MTFRGLKKVILGYQKLLRGSSYYPEEKRKKRFRILLENVRWTLKYGEVNDFYYLYGFDCKGVNIFKSDYVPYRTFMEQRNAQNYRVKWAIAPLRNKYYFYLIFKELGLPSRRVIEKVKVSTSQDSLDLINKYRDSDVFVKSVDGECADKVYHIHNKMKDFVILSGNYIVQEKVVQSDYMAEINPDSVNTLRIVTYKVGDKIQVLSSGLRVGTSRSGSVDNWAAGGLYIPISNCRLTKFGFYNIQWAEKVTTHPNSNFEFSNKEIPFYDEAVQASIKAHNMIDNIASIGWDVAITNNGPVFIEGNDNWEISLMQAGLDNGLKNAWLKSI